MAQLDEQDFIKKCDRAMEELAQKLMVIGDDNEFEVEGGSGKIEVEFEDEVGTRFVISPNAPVRQIWISALTTSFKLGWSEEKEAFVLDKTGETLNETMGRILTEKLGIQVKV